MKRLSFILLIALMVGFSPPAKAQDSTKTYSGQGITLRYPQSWFLFEKENGVGLSNITLDAEPDISIVAPGRVTVRVMLLGTYDQITSDESDPNFLLGYYASLYSQSYVWAEIFRARSGGVNLGGVELSIDVGQAEDFSSDEKSVLMVHQSISLVNNAEFLVILVEDSTIVAASAPAGELDEWTETILEIANSIEYE